MPPPPSVGTLAPHPSQTESTLKVPYKPHLLHMKGLRLLDYKYLKYLSFSTLPFDSLSFTGYKTRVFLG